MRLLYWNKLPGRGEYIRLLLEDAGASYDDVCRGPEGHAPLLAAMRGEVDGDPVFAPPILEVDGLRLAQVAAISDFLGQRLGLCPAGPVDRARALQHALTVADVVSEVHDTHHPVGTSLYFEDQRDAAIRAAELFRTTRLRRWLRHFEAILAARGPGLLGPVTYPDLHLFQTVEGLRYAFPTATAEVLADRPRVVALCAEVRARPGVSDYLVSERRLAFNDDGLFRAYPELDGPAR